MVAARLLAGVVQTAAEARKLLARAGTLAELQTAAERQLDLQAALSAGPLAELQTAADPGTAGFCMRLNQLGHSRIANSCRSRGSWVLQAALSAGSLAELQTAASRQLGSQGAL